MKTIKVSQVHYEMAKERMKRRKAKALEKYIEILIEEDYSTR
jgi:hypothetical protein